jgi:hypothetical protein
MAILNQYHKHQKILEDIDIAKRKFAYEMHTQGKSSVVIPSYNAERVEPYLNWMIYSTALLERSYLEFEKRRTMDRAMLQVFLLTLVVLVPSPNLCRFRHCSISTRPSSRHSNLTVT